jgi:predicted PurR-regulated permease PerM
MSMTATHQGGAPDSDNATAPRTVAVADLVPDWLIQLGSVGWRLLATILLAAVALEVAAILSTVTVSVVLAIVLAATFAPFVMRMRDRGASRTRAAALVTAGAVVVITLALVLMILAFVPYIDQVRTGLQTAISTLRDQLASMDVPPQVADMVDQARSSVDAWLSQATGSIVGSAASVATVAILGGFTTFFLLQDGDKAWVWAMQAATDWRRDAITTSGHVALERVGGYLRGTTILAAFHAVADLIFLLILGVPLAGPLAVFAFITQFIPYLGGMIATVVLVAVTYATVGVQAVVLLLVMITALNIVQGNILGPVVYHKTVDIHPALVLVAMPAGYAIAGIIGLFAAIPVVAFILAVGGSIIEVLGTEPPEERSGAGPEVTGTLVPVWLDRLGQWSWRLLVVAVLLAIGIDLVVMFPVVVMPVVLSTIFAATLAAPMAALRGRGWGTSRAAAASVAGALVVVIGIVVLTVVSLVPPIAEIVQNAIDGAGSADSATGGALDFLIQAVQEFGGAIATAVAGAVSSIASLVTILLLSTFLTFYFLRDGERFWAYLVARVHGPRARILESSGGRVVEILGGYMVGTGLISAFGAATQWLIMTILGIPFALPLAVLSFFGGFIPYVGSFVTTGLAFLVTVALGDTTDVLVMGIFTVVFNIVQGNIVAPIVYGRVVSLHPAIVLLAIPAGADLAGITGMFLIVPILGVVAATWRTWLHMFEVAPEVPAPRPSDEAGAHGPPGRSWRPRRRPPVPADQPSS